MIDYTSVEAFSRTFPDVSEDLQKVLCLTPYAPDAFAPGCALAASRGYLGCLPFARMGKDELVLRLLPKRALHEVPLVIAWGKSDVTDGTTIAANISHCVAGLLIGQNWGSAPGEKAIPLPAVRQQLLAFADELGDAGSCRRVLDALDRDFPPDYWECQSLLYAQADSQDPLFTILSVTHSKMSVEERIAWVKRIIPLRRDVDILWRLFVSIATEEETLDISEAAWQLVQRDDVYDCNYKVSFAGARPGGWKVKPLMNAIRWLKKRNVQDIPIHLDLWEAAQAYEAKGDTYAGELHLVYARRIAEQDPLQAYTHAANAVAYLYRAKHKVYAEAIGLAYELAKSQGWQELETVLRWSLDEMRSALQRMKSR